MKVWLEDSTLTDIANAIRAKNGNLNEYRPAQMGNAIRQLGVSGGGDGYPEPVGTISITRNGERNVKDYASVDVNVPNSYAARDEGKVVSNGALVAQTSKNVTKNGTYDTTVNNEVVVNIEDTGTPDGYLFSDGVLNIWETTDSIVLGSKSITQNGSYFAEDDNVDGYSQVNVNIQGGAPVINRLEVSANGTYTASSGIDGYSPVVVNISGTYGAADEGKVVSSGTLVSQTTRNVTSNGTYDTTTNDEVIVNVSQGYTAADEGKVVSNGALVMQTAMTVTQNGQYDTTEKNSILVNVSNSDFGNTEEFTFFREVNNEHEYILVQRIGTDGLTSVITFTDLQYSDTPITLVAGNLLIVDAYYDSEGNHMNVRIYSDDYSGTYEETTLASNGFATRTGSLSQPMIIYGDPKLIYFKFTRSVS